MAWAKDCPQNYQHKQRLVEAELMSLRLSRICSSKQKCHTQEFYDVAIEGALREGFLHEAALAKKKLEVPPWHVDIGMRLALCTCSGKQRRRRNI
jgi:hypothetical protein